jgi:hypothetical protein
MKDVENANNWAMLMASARRNIRAASKFAILNAIMRRTETELWSATAINIKNAPTGSKEQENDWDAHVFPVASHGDHPSPPDDYTIVEHVLEQI